MGPSPRLWSSERWSLGLFSDLFQPLLYIFCCASQVRYIVRIAPSTLFSFRSPHPSTTCSIHLPDHPTPISAPNGHIDVIALRHSAKATGPRHPCNIRDRLHFRPTGPPAPAVAQVSDLHNRAVCYREMGSEARGHPMSTTMPMPMSCPPGCMRVPIVHTLHLFRVLPPIIPTTGMWKMFPDATTPWTIYFLQFPSKVARTVPAIRAHCLP